MGGRFVNTGYFDALLSLTDEELLQVAESQRIMYEAAKPPRPQNTEESRALDVIGLLGLII